MSKKNNAKRQAYAKKQEQIPILQKYFLMLLVVCLTAVLMMMLAIYSSELSMPLWVKTMIYKLTPNSCLCGKQNMLLTLQVVTETQN